MNQGAWWDTVPRATKSDMTESLTLFGKLRTANRGRALPLNEEGGKTVSGQRRLIEVLKLEFLLSCVQRRKLRVYVSSSSTVGVYPLFLLTYHLNPFFFSFFTD